VTGDDIFGLFERLDRIAVALERIADSAQPVTTTATDTVSPMYRRACGAVHPTAPWPCLLTAEHGCRHMDANERRW
jgi:hypothetical protein